MRCYYTCKDILIMIVDTPSKTGNTWKPVAPLYIVGALFNTGHTWILWQYYMVGTWSNTGYTWILWQYYMVGTWSNTGYTWKPVAQLYIVGALFNTGHTWILWQYYMVGTWSNTGYTWKPVAITSLNTPSQLVLSIINSLQFVDGLPRIKDNSIHSTLYIASGSRTNQALIHTPIVSIYKPL